MVRVTVQRTINTGLIRLLGAGATSMITARAVGAIVSENSPIPIIVTHPTLTSAFKSNGGATVIICGGPRRSIQVNSLPSTGNATDLANGTTIDLHLAGPDDGAGTCTTGTGADFGTFGGPSTPNFTFLPGTKGQYIQPSSPIKDPFASVAPPAKPGAAPAPAALADGVNGCPATPFKPCMLYSPGWYTTAISVQNETAIFKPGVYYMEGVNFENRANGAMKMSTGFADSAETGGQGIMVYHTGAGTFNVGANSGADLLGSAAGSSYKGILFFQDRAAPANTGAGGSDSHKFGGGGEVSLIGTIYITNSEAIMRATPGQYQLVQFQGNPGSTTLIRGEIVASSILIAGNSEVKMQLDPSQAFVIRKVALVR
jgi:hypothetical protein